MSGTYRQGLVRVTVVLVALCGVAAAAPVKLAPGSRKPVKTAKTQAEIANQRNWDGEQLYAKKKYKDASQAFREAVARVPESRYFYNLCASLYEDGAYSSALTACHAVSNQEPSPQLEKMTKVLVGLIHEAAKKQGIEVQR